MQTKHVGVQLRLLAPSQVPVLCRNLKKEEKQHEMAGSILLWSTIRGLVSMLELQTRRPHR